MLGEEGKSRAWIKIMESWNGLEIISFHPGTLSTVPGLGHFKRSEGSHSFSGISIPGRNSFPTFPPHTQSNPIYLGIFPLLPLGVSQGQLLVWFGKFLLKRSPNKPRKRNGSWEVLIDFPDLQMKGRGETLCVNYGQNEGPKSPGSSGKKSFGERRTPFLWLQDHRENFSSRN